MGFLNRLLNPIEHIKDTKRTLSGDVGNSFFLSPFTAGNGSSVKSNPATNGGYQVDPSMYGGDPNDSQFGSLTAPFDVEQFYKYQDPGYAFRLQQGTQGLQNSAAAGSGALSGAALKDLLQYNQDYASTEYGNAFNRYQTQQGNIYNRLFGIAQLGQNAAAGVGQQGTQLAGNAGQFISNAGSAAGAGYVGAGNALGQGVQNYWLMRQFNNQPVASGPQGQV